MGETRVDLQHLLEDLRDAYVGLLEETILTEVIANSLDSGASQIRISCDPASSTLTLVDNGTGMHRRDLNRYHDIATSTKTRGQGIGFAGVGIKLGLLVSESVLTETRRGKTHVASLWHLASRYRAPWKWVPPPGLVTGQGTAVQLRLHNPLSPLLDPGFLEGTLRRHFQPLFDPSFDGILGEHYPEGIEFEVNRSRLEKLHVQNVEQAPLEIRLLRKRKPSAVGYLVRGTSPLPDEQHGLAISTFGKVIKRGWDWLGVSPSSPELVGGLIEIPALAASLTLNKADFIRVGARGAAFLAYRKALQEAVSRQFSLWGESSVSPSESAQRQMRPLERDMERVLEDLSDLFPLLGSLVDRRAGGQKRLPLGQPGSMSDGRAAVNAMVLGQEQKKAEPSETAGPTEKSSDENMPVSSLSDQDTSESPDTKGGVILPDRGGPKRAARYGLQIQLEDGGKDGDLGRLVESTVLVNQEHPAYQRAVASRSVGYHIALSVAMALAPLAVETGNEHSFLTSFLGRWGEGVSTKAQVRRKSK